MCFPGRVEVACWAGRSVVLLTSGRRCRLEGRLEAGFALRPRAFRQAPPIFSVGVINLGGPESSPTCAQGSRCFPDILWCGLAPQVTSTEITTTIGMARYDLYRVPKGFIGLWINFWNHF